GPQDEGAMLMALADTVVNGDVSLKKGALGDDVFTSLYYNLTPQQTAVLKESPYLTELLDCDYQYRFWSHGLEEQEQLDAYLDLEKRVLSLAEQAPHLSCSYYLLGNLYGYASIGGSLSGEGGAIDNEKAIEYYRKSLKIDPEQAVVWYSLAQTLDEEEQYKAAYEAATKAYELAAGDYNQAWGETFHGYGTIVHVNSLLVHLENYLRQNPE
ncbi:MAG: tetratricopeptide repeat protein, partial [Lachnospiraceae bacterium]|nr:tetratricopeptide repeat protein [Lachnospiraceae bacterium]